MDKIKLEGLHPVEFQHTLDMKAIKALSTNKGFKTLVTQFNKHGIERVLRIQLTGSAIKINERNFPDISAYLEQACVTLDVKSVPPLYAEWNYSINGGVVGVEKPMININSGCIDLLSEEELIFLLGHEMGHIKCNHVLYHQMAQIMPIIGGIIGDLTLGIGGILATGLELALLNWYRMSEFSSDRAGLLACQDIDVAVKVLSKMAGTPGKYFDSINTEDFLDQAREFEGFDYDKLDKIAKAVSIMGSTHPWTVMRASELLKWIESGEYDKVLNRQAGTFCPACSAETKETEKFCRFCGQKL